MQDQAIVVRQVAAALDAPTDPTQLQAWLSLKPSVDFLAANAKSDSVIVYLSAAHMLVLSALVPTASISPPDWTDLKRWSADASSSWSVWTSGENVGLEPPLGHDDSRTIAGGEQLIYRRSFEGVPERGNYFEVLQKFVHVLSLHHMPDRDAWCRLDRHGDIEDVVRVVRIEEGRHKGSGGWMVLCDRTALATYATLTDATLVRMFDFTFTGSSFNVWDNRGERARACGKSIRYRHCYSGGYSAYARGAEVVSLPGSKKDVANRMWGGEPDKKYATFIAVDWKNNRIGQISCAPKALANYFTKSKKPYEVSPAFFRPEVLLKYKADTEKYTLRDRAITCRGAWHLQTYDINEEGQVHTYLIYLSRLPYEEQLHWKQYNEAPKGPLSERAFKTDFQGEWSSAYDPLPSLKHKLDDLRATSCPWWKLRDRDLMEKAHYPATTSPDEWAEEVLRLDQLLVEGFDEKALRARCGEPDLRVRSLGLVERCLVQYGFDEERARELVKPLRDLHELRSKVKGHASGSDAKNLRQQAKKEHGSLRQHYRAMVQQCDESLEAIAAALNADLAS